MRNIYAILLLLSAGCLVGCVSYSDKQPYWQDQDFGEYAPYCAQETVVTIQDEQGYMEVPACYDYSYNVEVMPVVQPQPPAPVETAPEVEPVEEAPAVPATKKIKKQIKTTRKIIPQFEQEYNPDDVEGDFPEVERNKYISEIVLENQNTHVLAFCRGTEEQAERCATRLENYSSCYVRVNNIPYLAAKYDKLKTGTYPTRRWREGEYVPRW